MILGKKMALLGLTAIVSTVLLASFTSKPDDDKKKKYQIIHHSNGEMIVHDTIIPMSSNYSVEDFLADKGIDNDDIEIIQIPSASDMKHSSESHMIIREISEEVDGENSERVEIQVEIDDDGNQTITKTVNGEEVELTEEELESIESHKIEDDGVMMIKIDGSEGLNSFESSENVEIQVEIDEDGNRTIKKMVNGEEVELTGEEIENMEIHQMEGNNIMVVLNESDMDGLEEGDHKVIIREMRIDHEGSEGLDLEMDFEWISESGDGEIMMMGGEEDFTIVIVMEDYDENMEGKHKIKLSTSNDNVDVYPNPNDGTFTIRFSQSEKVKTTVKVTDSKGKIVFEDKLGKFKGDYNEQIDLKKFGAGTYIIAIEAGNNIEKTKVIIK